MYSAAHSAVCWVALKAALLADYKDMRPGAEEMNVDESVEVVKERRERVLRVA